MKLGLSHWRFALVLSAFLLTAASRAAGPGFFNATDGPVELRAKFADGPDFVITLPAGKVVLFSFAWQVTELEAHLNGGTLIKVAKDKAASLRRDIDKPRNQVWVIDGTQVCVVSARKSVPETGFHCASSSPK
jgi:hypothetical protein